MCRCCCPTRPPPPTGRSPATWSTLLDEELPDDDDDDDAEPMGDLGMLADLGLSDFDLGAIIDNLDLSSDQMLMEIADKINIGPQFRKVAEAALQD